MYRLTDPVDLPPSLHGAAVAIGNFDGVHLGHQSVLDIARAQAKSDDKPFGVLTFEPHPREFFGALKGQEMPPFRLMNADSRAHRLEKLGVDVLFEIPFNLDLANLTDTAFSKDILAEQCKLSHVVVGADFCFGQGRSGTIETLTSHGADFGFGVSIAPLAETQDLTISSTNIRKALANGNPGLAADMLGHWHRIEGPVLHGEKRGRELGFPTANMSIDGLHAPKFGVYAVLIDVLTGPHQGSYHGAASIGVRPMFGVNTANCETYIFDFKGDLYGETLSVGLVKYLRGEEKLEGLVALIDQMDQDCDQARALLSSL